MGMIIDGKEIAGKIQKEMEYAFRSFNRRISICEISFGQHEESGIYSRTRRNIARKFGIEIFSEIIPESADQKYSEDRVAKLAESEYNAIFLSMPLPADISAERLVSLIPENKDMEGLGPANIASLMQGRNSVYPATAKAIVHIIEGLKLNKGSRVCIINRSKIIGRPLAMALINLDYTVTVCHSRTPDIMKISRDSDVIVTATGRPGFLTREYVTERSIVIDASIISKDGRVVGDAVQDLKEYVAMITPVPGGVGPVTNIMAFSNLYELLLRQN